MTITKKKIAKTLSKNLSVKLENGSDIVDTFLSIIKLNSRKKLVKLSGFGTFGTKKTPHRVGRNPKTKESYIIPSINKPFFKASNKTKEILN